MTECVLAFSRGVVKGSGEVSVTMTVRLLCGWVRVFDPHFPVQRFSSVYTSVSRHPTSISALPALSSFTISSADRGSLRASNSQFGPLSRSLSLWGMKLMRPGRPSDWFKTLNQRNTLDWANGEKSLGKP